MGRSRFVALLVALLSLVGGAVAVAQEGTGLLAAAEDAADEAAQNARELVDQATEEQEATEVETDGEDGESQGFGSAAFRDRHAMLASKFEEMGHPVFDEHPAARVHRALANGEHPSGMGQAQAEAARRMADARREVAGADDGQGGPPDHAGRPDHAGPKGDE